LFPTANVTDGSRTVEVDKAKVRACSNA